MSKNAIGDLAKEIRNTMQARAKNVSVKVRPEMQSGDAENIPRSQWYEMIRQNWHDPEWRQRQGIQRDPVKLVQDALEAHGLNSSLLNQNKDVIRLGLSQWKVDGTEQYNKFMEQYGGAITPEPIPQLPQNTTPENQPPAPPQPIPVIPVQPDNAQQGIPVDPTQLPQPVQPQQPTGF